MCSWGSHGWKKVIEQWNDVTIKFLKQSKHLLHCAWVEAAHSIWWRYSKLCIIVLSVPWPGPSLGIMNSKKMLSICTAIYMFYLVKITDSPYSITLYEIRERCFDFTNKKTCNGLICGHLKGSLQIWVWSPGIFSLNACVWNSAAFKMLVDSWANFWCICVLFAVHVTSVVVIYNVSLTI